MAMFMPPQAMADRKASKNKINVTVGEPNVFSWASAKAVRISAGRLARFLELTL
jgi:hypothetical protein